MKSILTPFLLFCLIVFNACQSTSDHKEADVSSKKATEEFAENAHDDNFTKSHEAPKALKDFKFDGDAIKFQTADEAGIGYGFQLTAQPASKDYLLVVHEWYGVNENILSEAMRHYAKLEGKVNVIVLDLYDGKSTKDPEEAGKLMQAASTERCQAIVEGAIAYVGDDARIGTIGWCFGGGWSLQTALAAKDNGHACVIYYGMPEMQADKLAGLNAEVLGIFAKQDKWINPEVVNDFTSVMTAINKPITVHSFEADHAFANPSGQRYNKEAATEANQLVDEFLKRKFL
ncbi:MAG: dienelactone hydrolase family protein [Bacteroidota bacterium]